MSSLIVEVCKIDDVRPHPNAERLELAIVKGWQCVVGKGHFKQGDTITYIPIDSVLPVELSDKIGVTKYLSNGRVRCARLRGEPSFGVIDVPHGEVGENVASKLGITKYAPPLKLSAGDAESPHPLFDAYTDIENMRNFTDVFIAGEPVVGTEKIHGTNSRIGIVTNEDGQRIHVAGSKGVQRQYADNSTYWYPWKIPAVVAMMEAVSAGHKQTIMYGEVYGKVQSLRYGLPQGIAYRAFDIKRDGRYMDPGEFADTCAEFGVQRCPVLYSGPFDIASIRSASEGPSLIPGADNIREGIVVRPMRERTHPSVGRVILKYVSDAYLLGDNDDAGE